MGLLKWYKRDPRAAIVGMTGMTLEERGAYNTILDLIYCHDGALPDDPAYICDVLNCDPRIWRRLKARLLERGKIYMHANSIRNERADHETFSALTRVRVATEAINRRWATYNDIKRLSDTPVLLPTTRKKESLSANIVPIAKRPSEVSKKELEEQFERKRNTPDISHETPLRGR